MVDHAVSLLTFPRPLTVRGDVFGTVWPLDVGNDGVTAEVRLVQLRVVTADEVGYPEGVDGPDQFEPSTPDFPDAERVSELLSSAEGDAVEWAITFHWGPEGEVDCIGRVAHAALVVQFADDLTDAELRRAALDDAAKKADTWCTEFDAWLSIRETSRIHPGAVPAKVRKRYECASEEWLVQDAEAASGWNQLRSTPPKQPSVIVEMQGDRELAYENFALTPDDWMYAHRAQISGTEIPAEWELLDSGFRALREERFRVAVLDAATVLELVLTNVVRGHFVDSNSPNTVAAVMSRVGTLGRLLDLVRDLGYMLPPTLNNDVVALRNRVAHRNYRATHFEAGSALGRVRAVLLEFAPLPELS